MKSIPRMQVSYKNRPKAKRAKAAQSHPGNSFVRKGLSSWTAGLCAPRPHSRLRTPSGSFRGASLASRRRRATAFDTHASLNPSRQPEPSQQKSHVAPTNPKVRAEGAMAGASCQQTAAVLRLQSDLKAIKTEPPDVSSHPSRAHRDASTAAHGGRAPLPRNPRS